MLASTAHRAVALGEAWALLASARSRAHGRGAALTVKRLAGQLVGEPINPQPVAPAAER